VRDSIEKKLHTNDFDLLKSTNEIEKQLSDLEKQCRELMDNGSLSWLSFEVQFDETILEDPISSLGSIQQVPPLL
jgi:hypothetical protein